ncbi:TonB-dependent siderophore receptor [Thiomicrorhabdus sp. Kp2]|uniref:TonB-dependent receptor plug domain-containing protein n=1 Tax=Thiomicrorhabdus sp. Kp2 TaxID=1123518 RepID=UPI0004032D23|nr:TonB-dependent receptor [Thiomicrorhabdus sp. Kp2]
MKLSKLSAAILAATFSQTVFADATDLDNIVVSANNMSQNIQSVTSQVNVITREDIEQKNYQILGDALKIVPGVSVKNTGGLGKSSSIFMRGASSSDRQALILIDGIEQTDPAGIGANVANMLLSNVERIEILKGPQSGVWGANASAGVINIITIKGQKIANVNVEVGSNNTKKLATTLGANNKQFDFAFHLEDISTDGFTAIKPYHSNESSYEDDGFNQTDVSFKMGINITPAHRIETLIKNTSASNEYDSGTNPDDASLYNDNEITTRQLQYLYNQDKINGRIYINEQTMNAFYSGYGGYSTDGLIEGLGGQLGYQYGQQNALNVSLEKKHFRDTLSDTEYTNTGYAIANSHYLTPSLVLNEALRYDEYDNFDNATTGKIGLKNHFTDQIFIAANYGTGYNAPSLYQVSRPANPTELKPESVEGYEFTLGAYGAELTYFNSQTKDKLEALGSWFNGYYVNADGKTTTEGWELSYQKELNAISTHFAVNATWLTAKNEDKQLKAYIPQQQANFTVDNYSITNLHLGLETRYTGTNYSADDEVGAQIGEYFVTDFNIDYQVNKNLNLYAKVVNLTDEDYITSVADWPATNVTPNYVYANGGRQFFMGVRGSL